MKPRYHKIVKTDAIMLLFSDWIIITMRGIKADPYELINLKIQITLLPWDGHCFLEGSSFR